ncbi:RNA polymerase-binding ATPase [Ventosimonas gracilis]|uniref:RNA polymerase-associated protein RapA n=1 Tax=Ventosimonas gracilis TaxID=1680762 RepID=A0A139SHJ3_9GAMM|nr:RNA polymerase-associated protein RapA [Ventosimonas gracilis]KXU33954.1 RNA polymerase-binding ATPase [Ventosimonas gracilis]
MAQYVSGQRWLSDSESELGLGTVLSQDERMVTLHYPASGETRRYALQRAPLTRVRFSPGDEISHFDGWRMMVQEVEEAQGLLIYHGPNATRLPETELSNFIQFRSASDRLLAGQIDPLAWFTLRYQTLQQRSRLLQSPLWGLCGARAEPIAHQLHIAREVADRARPRVLLADEVGLGKTIEAGLIIHRRLLSGRAQRVLIVLPENLQHQWLVELLRRFNLHASLFDAQRFIQSDGDNPFEDSQLVLASLSWLVQDEQAAAALQAAHWDMLVVDEAHHLLWHPEQASGEYLLVERLAGQIDSVLLLTATPEQLGQDSHFARLRLLDPARFHDFAAFREEAAHYRPVAGAVQELLEQPSLSPRAKQQIAHFLGEEGETLLAAQSTDSGARDRLIRALMDRHGTGRLLFRNTRAAVRGFAERDLHPFALENPVEYQSLMPGEHADLYPELSWQLQATGDERRWWQFDPRVDWLLDTLKMLKQFKVLVICAHAETALDLGDALRKFGIGAAVFHEGMSLLERDRSAAWFADAEFGARVLICSEIGSEGRNFQFSHHLVLFDLPSHPDLLEQRIGRLDRIGQQQRIQIHLPYLQNSPQERLFQWYHQALNAFLATCPTGNALQQQFGCELLSLLEGGDPTAWQQLLEKARQERLRLTEELQQGRDRLLEIASSGAGQGEQLAHAIGEQDEQFALPVYMEMLLDAFGIDSEEHSQNALILRPSEKMLDTSFPLGASEAVTVTYDREQALSREDMQFLTWEHPMVQGGMDLVLAGTMGNSAVALIKNKALKPGTLLLEILFTSECVAPKTLQLSRFLPQAAMRCLLNEQGQDLAEKVAFNTLNAQLESVARNNAARFIKAQREVIAALIKTAEQQAAPRHQQRVAKAQKHFEQALQEETNRLIALQKINKAVSQNEIKALQQQREQGLQLLGKARLRLEAIRVLVAA